MSNSSYIIDLNIPSGITTDDASTKPVVEIAKSNSISLETAPAAVRAKRRSFIQTDLKSAFDNWQELEKVEACMSPEEEQFVKIKSIIGQLKDKLQQF